MNQPAMDRPPLEHILYIEDDKDIQKIAKIALEGVGKFKVNFSDNGALGVEDAQTLKPQLIMLDVMMPVMDGPTAIQKLKAETQTSDIPVVFITARIQDHERQEYIEMGAVSVIAKPFDPMTLAKQINDIWNGLSS